MILNSTNYSDGGAKQPIRLKARKAIKKSRDTRAR